MSYPAIVYPLTLEYPNVTGYFVWNAACALVCSLALAFLILQMPSRLTRLALLMAGSLNVLFQWPLALFSEPVRNALADPVFFSLCVHLPVATSILWVVFTPQLAWTGRPGRENLEGRVCIPGLALVGLSAVFLFFMPFYCTALSAVLFDPSNTLLAREVTIKLAGSTIATSSYGAVANAAAPATAGLALVLLIQRLGGAKVGRAAFWFAVICICFAAVLIEGAKGLLIPLMIVVAFSAVGSFRSIFGKVAASSLSALCLMGMLASFEVLKERGGREIPYDFVGCVVHLGTADKGRELLQSMANGGLSLSPTQIGSIMADLENAGGKALVPLAPPPRVKPTPERAATYLGAIGYRAFVIPIQGAAWHHLYVDHYGSPGVGTLPFALKVLGFSTDATSLVYQKYGVIFSGGDATSTSTAPTSFVFAYPAYFGWVGLLVAIIAILFLDGVTALASRRFGPTTLSVSGGLLAVICFNSSTSDLFSVLMSHGGAVAISIIIAWGVFVRRERLPKDDTATMAVT